MLSTILILFSTVIGLVASIFFARANRFRKFSPFFYGIFIFFCIAGILLIMVENKNLNKETAQKRWPTVPGIVKSSQVSKTRGLQPKIVYAYKVNGQKFLGETNLNTPAFGGKNTRLETAEAIIAKYPSGKSVPVYYNPENPAQSSLKVGPTWDVFMKLSLGVFLLIAGVMGVGTAGIATTKKAKNLFNV